MSTQLNIDFEEWRPIEGYEGLYEVSNLGRVRSIDRIVNKHLINGKILNVRNGIYLTVTLSKNGKAKQMTIHRIVAIAFIPNQNNYGYIDHIDGNKHNNNASNLRWVTCSMNMNNPITLEKMKHINDGRVITEETRLKQSESHKGKTIPKEQREKMSLSQKQRYIDNPSLRIRSEEQRLKCSIALKGKYVGWDNKSSKPIMQFTLNGKYMATYASATDAAKHLNLKRECIRDCCLGRQKTAYGYIWKYKEAS